MAWKEIPGRSGWLFKDDAAVSTFTYLGAGTSVANAAKTTGGVRTDRGVQTYIQTRQTTDAETVNRGEIDATSTLASVGVVGPQPASFFSSLPVSGVQPFGGQAFTYALTSETDPTSANWTTKPAGYTYYPGEGIGADAPITNMSNMFYNVPTFNEDISSWDVSSVTRMDYMFRNADGFNNGGVTLSGNFASTMSNVINMEAMFRFTDGAGAFDQDISSWDVSSVENMFNMFNNASIFNNGGVALNWGVKTANVQNMNSMFNNATTFNQDISSWDVSSVNNMNQMFYLASAFNQNISSWNVSSVINMTQMFLSAIAFNQNLNTWNVTNIPSAPNNFATGATLFTTDEHPIWGTILYPLSNTATDPTSTAWRTANPTYQFVANVGILMPAGSPITSMVAMFNGSAINDPDISSWDVSTVINMLGMFQNATTFNQDISGWVVTSVTTMGNMFFNATAFNQNISSWNTSSAGNMSEMFGNAAAFNQDISGWVVTSVTNATNFSLGAGQKGTLVANWQEAEHPSNAGLGNFYNT